MSTKIYFFINAILYLIFGVWCAVQPDWTASAVGLVPLGAQGTAEYVAVYGGLEFALGVFFLICALNSTYQTAGIVFGSCLYLGLFLFRTIAIANVGSDIGNGMNFYIIEIFFTIWSLYLLKQRKNSL